VQIVVLRQPIKVVLEVGVFLEIVRRLPKHVDLFYLLVRAFQLGVKLEKLPTFGDAGTLKMKNRDVQS
jgi:hypothetical protein